MGKDAGRDVRGVAVSASGTDRLRDGRKAALRTGCYERCASDVVAHPVVAADREGARPIEVTVLSFVSGGTEPSTPRSRVG